MINAYLEGVSVRKGICGESMEGGSGIIICVVVRSGELVEVVEVVGGGGGGGWSAGSKICEATVRESKRGV